MDINTLLPDEAFENSFQRGPVEPGKYKLKVFPKVYARKAKSGDRYISLGLAAVENENGNRVNSDIINKILPIEGVDSKGNSKCGMFAGFFSALGLEKEQVRNLLATLHETLPADPDGEEVNLSIAGEPLYLEGRFVMGSVKVEEYQGEDKNSVSSVWAVTE